MQGGERNIMVTIRVAIGWGGLQGGVDPSLFKGDEIIERH